MVEADSVGTASSEGLGYATKIMRCVGTESNVIECTYTNVNSSCRTVATVTCINPSKLCHIKVILKGQTGSRGSSNVTYASKGGGGKQSVTTPSLLY